MFTVNQVVEQRSKEVYNEVRDIEERMSALRNELERLEHRREFLIAESQMLEMIGDRGMLIDTRRPGRPKNDRMAFEDAVKTIFDQAGVPIKIGHLINELERFGWSYSRNTWYTKIRSLDYLQPTGEFGYYNLLRGRL